MKMRTALVFQILIIAFTVLTPKVSHADEVWRARMQSIAASMTCLMPYLSDDDKFADPKNLKQIRTCTDELAKDTNELAQTLSSHSKNENSGYKQDPLLPLTAQVFAEDVSGAKAILSFSNKHYAQHLLRQATVYCVACHTRKERDTKAEPFPLLDSASAGLSILERMRYETAMRNFDVALSDYRGLLAPNSKDNLSSIQFEQATRLAFLISMSVLGDEQKARQLIADVLKSKRPSPSLRSEIERWRTTLDSVFAETAKPADAKAKVQFADTLLKSAVASSSNGAGKIPAVYYVRAATLLHSALNSPDSTMSDSALADVYYKLGVCYDNLETFGYWSIAEVYYEACILKAPGTSLAQKCFDGYQEDISLGYSGTAGLPLPTDVRDHLKKLEAKAKGKSSK